MKQFIIDWLSRPENIILVLICLIQTYKLIRPSLPETWRGNVDKVATFLGWAVPSLYNVIESLEGKGLIDKNSKFSVFLDYLFMEAKKQNIVLAPEDISKAKLLVEGMAQANKSPKTLPFPGSPTAEPSQTPSNSNPLGK